MFELGQRAWSLHIGPPPIVLILLVASHHMIIKLMFQIDGMYLVAQSAKYPLSPPGCSYTPVTAAFGVLMSVG